MIAIVGSSAANHWMPDLWPRPKDIDFIASWESFKDVVAGGVVATPVSSKLFVSEIGGVFVEWSIAWPGSSGHEFLMNLDPTRVGEAAGIRCMVPSLNDLFLLKTSHRYKANSPHFEKTRRDWLMLRNLGCKIENESLLRKRELETYSSRRTSLNKSKEEFFAGGERLYKYDHDSIHEAIAHLDQPAYLYYRKEGEEVQCDTRKWREASEDVRLFGVLEEVYVFALERSQIPFPDTDPFRSFKMALEKICTSVTSGFFRDYAYENYDAILAMYDPFYVERFRKAVDQGKVRKFK
jgi:hypothetical protein